MRILVGAAVVALSLGASSIQATNTEAVIESVVPTLPAGVSIDVVGADSFLRVRAAGHVVEVPGYEGEPYLRIDGDGRTRVNEASASAILNRDRYGSTAATDATSETPRWRTTGSNGTLLWHDHRIHWMSRSTPPTIDEAGTVLEFDVPVVVDSTTHVVSGVLYLRDEASPAWWGIAVLAAAAMYVASRRRRRATAVTAACVAALGVAVGVHEFLGMPAGARITPVLAGFTAIAAVSFVGSVVLERRDSSDAAAAFAAGGGTSMVLAAVLCAEQVRSAWIPGVAHPWEARIVVPMLLGVGTVVALRATVSLVRVPTDA